MNKMDIAYYLNNPDKIDAQTAERINHLIVEYPWSQPLRALFLKYVKENDKPVYQKHLNLTAAYTAQRGVLFEWLNQNRDIPVEKSTGMFPATIVEQSDKSDKEKKKKKNKKEKKKKKKPKLQQNQTIETGVISQEVSMKSSEEEKSDFFTWIKKLQNRQNAKENKLPAKIRKMKIIDEFLKKSPKIKPKPVTEELEKQPPVEVNENRFLMTETLAKLLWKQEKYDKAIQAYEILILKYPEKSRYFASQIEEIKKQKNKKLNR